MSELRQKLCLFCGSHITEANSSRDHVFPELIGGWFWVDFVCRACNSRFGSTFDNDLRKNPFVHAAISKLRIRTGHAHLAGQRITAKTESGYVGKVSYDSKSERYVIHPTPQADGSSIASDEISTRVNVAKLKAMGKSDKFIKEKYLNIQEIAPSGLWIPIEGTGIAFRRLKEERTEFSHDDMNSPFRYALVAKIAIEIMLALGVYFEMPFDLSPMISAIVDNDPALFTVSRVDYSHLGTPDEVPYEPFHYVKFAVISRHVVALVGFFGCLPFAICLGEVLESSAGECETHHFVFPIGKTREIHSNIPPDEIRDSHFGLMLGAFGSWIRRNE